MPARLADGLGFESSRSARRKLRTVRPVRFPGVGSPASRQISRNLGCWRTYIFSGGKRQSIDASCLAIVVWTLFFVGHGGNADGGTLDGGLRVLCHDRAARFVSQGRV